MFPKNTHFLIVDDFVTMRKVTRKTLADLGFSNVHEAEDGSRALALLKAAASTTEPFQFVIADMHMPSLEGPELWRACKDTSIICELPYLFLSTGVDSTTVLHGLKSSSSDYIIKPFTPKHLNDKLKEMWDAIQLTKNLRAS